MQLIKNQLFISFTNWIDNNKTYINIGKATNVIQYKLQYINAGADDEQEAMRIDLGNKVLESLINIGQSNITIEDIFSECETICIPLHYLEEFDENEDSLEIGDLEYECNVILIG